MRLLFSALVYVSLVIPAWAAGPESSPRPVARMAEGAVATVGEGAAGRRPEARPEVFEAALVSELVRKMEGLEPVARSEPLEFMQPILAFAMASPQAVAQALRPMERSKSLIQKVMAQRQRQERGSICGDPALQGELVGYVPGRISACGITEGVRVRSVEGIPLSQQALIDCPTAKALKTWINKGLKPSIGSRGGGVAQINVAAHYACRTRNNQAGGEVSEHGRGKAIDISGVTLRDGSTITVLQGWATRQDGPALSKMHDRACGIFGTVLGPNSDRFHQDHFHFDTARHGNGAYCR